MLRFIQSAIIYFVLIKAACVFMACLIIFCFFIKGRLCRMNREKWDLYFKTSSVNKFLSVGFILYIASLSLFTAAGHIIFKTLRLDSTGTLTAILFVVGIIYFILKYIRQRRIIIDKLLKITQREQQYD